MKILFPLFTFLLVGSLLSCSQEPVSQLSTSPPVITHAIGPVPGTLEQPAAGTNPYAGNADAVQEGRDLFLAFNCYGCHGGRGGGGMGPSLRDDSWMYGASGPSIYSSISEGRPHSMPAWGTKLPDNLVWKLTAYVQSMGTDQEPQRPR